MKPAKFDYLRAETAEEAIAALAQYGDDARILAGGQSLMPMLNMRLAQPQVLIDISQTRDLNFIHKHNDDLKIGAAATQAALEWRPSLVEELPLVAQAFPHISHFQIRNRGTACGSIAHADPSAELPLCLLAIGGSIGLRSSKGSRVVPAEEFFLGALQTAREDDELIEYVSFPIARSAQRFAFEEFSMRHGDYAIAAIAVVADENGTTVAAGGLSDRPERQYWRGVSSTTFEEGLIEWIDTLNTADGQHASANYRRHLLKVLSKRALKKIETNEN